jgi:hypothetical protein
MMYAWRLLIGPTSVPGRGYTEDTLAEALVPSYRTVHIHYSYGGF